MGIITWIVLGAIAGWLASLVTRTGDEHSFGMDIILGVAGAIVGGLLADLLGGYGITGLDIRSIIIATLGAVVLIFVVHAFRSGRSTTVR